MKDKPTLEIEQNLQKQGYKYVIGVDEAGRGPGAGPVVAAAVRIPEGFDISDINDSKKVAKKKRKKLCEIIKTECICTWSAVDENIVDAINILEATKLAMRNAIYNIVYADYVLIDGNFRVENIDIEQRSIIKGDSISASIASASIVAKVVRDAIMDELHEIYPIYGWDKNRGYLTKDHIEAIKLYKPSPFHRKTFRKVREHI